jgi:hypothetical protein
MRIACRLCLALLAVVACAICRARLGGPGEPIRPAAADRDRALDEADRRIDAIAARLALAGAPAGSPDVARLSERVERLRRDVADAIQPAPLPPSTARAPATYDDLIERANARGGFWDAYDDVLAEEIANWRLIAEHAVDAAQRAGAWAEVARLCGMGGLRDATDEARWRVVESVGLRSEQGRAAARALANSEWGHGDIADAARLFREFGGAPGAPKEFKLQLRWLGTSLTCCACPADEAVRVHREFIADYEDDPDPTAGRLVAAARDAVTRLEAGGR